MLYIIYVDIISEIISQKHTCLIECRHDEMIMADELIMKAVKRRNKMGKKENNEDHPITVDDHKELGRRHKDSAVNEALKFPTGSAFDEAISELLTSDIEESGETVVIALIDLDSFAHINKELGIKEGDRVLIETGLYIKEAVGDMGEVYRIGGDEFGIIFKGLTEREEIFLKLNEIRKEYNVVTASGERMTMTIGMATAFEDANRCPELIRKADSALYRAKISGRDKVAMAKEEKMIPKTSHYTQDQLKRLAMLGKREGVGEAILLREALDMLLKKYDI